MNATITSTTAQPTKLRNGTWGAKIETIDRIDVGTNVTVRTKAGKTWTTQVAKIVWSGKSDNARNVYIFATTGGGQQQASSRGRGGNYRRYSHCQQCRAEGRKCWQCAFDDE